MTKKKQRPGSEFEEAVYHFAQKLDPSAEVLFNHSVPDRDTGEPRQCDVWINAKFGGHWPLAILVSCKDHKRKLHSGDIGTFRDEVRSTGASTGIIYSRADFTEPGLRKAQANGFPCCRIYQREPADIPESFFF
jgi:predicted helicase